MEKLRKYIAIEDTPTPEHVNDVMVKKGEEYEIQNYDDDFVKITGKLYNSLGGFSRAKEKFLNKQYCLPYVKEILNKEHLIEPAIFYSHNDYENENKSVAEKYGYILLSEDKEFEGLKEYKQTIFSNKVGEIHCSHYGAPGIGKCLSFITKIDEQGMWGVTIEDTLQIMKPEDCI